MRITKIAVTADGGSRLQQFELALRPDEAGKITGDVSAQRAYLRQYRVGLFVDFHRAPQRMLITVLSGTLEVEDTAGTRALIQPAEALFVTDLTGRGHVSRSPSGALCLYIVVSDEFEIEQVCCETEIPMNAT